MRNVDRRLGRRFRARFAFWPESQGVALGWRGPRRWRSESTRKLVIHVAEVGAGGLGLPQAGFAGLAEALAEFLAEGADQFQPDQRVALHELLEGVAVDGKDHGGLGDDDVGGGPLLGVENVHFAHGFAGVDGGHLQGVGMGADEDVEAAGEEHREGVVGLALRGQVGPVGKRFKVARARQGPPGGIAHLAEDPRGGKRLGGERRGSGQVGHSGKLGLAAAKGKPRQRGRPLALLGAIGLGEVGLAKQWACRRCTHNPSPNPMPLRKPRPHLPTALIWLAAGLLRAPAAPESALAMRLIKGSCLSCHSEEKRKGGLAMTSRELLLQGGESGAALVEGKPAESLLVQSLAAGADPHMPPKKQLSAAQIKVLEDWVRRGAPWDAAALAGGTSPSRAVAPGLLPEACRPVLALALSPDNARLAVGCRNEVVLFEVGATALKFLARARAQLDPVESLAWLPDGKHLVSGAFRRVILWDAAALTPVRETSTGLTDRISALQVLPGGAQVLLADGQVAENGFVRVLEVASGQVLRSWQAHGDTIFAMALSPDGKLLATAGGDKLVKLWELPAGTEVAKLEAHATQVLGLSFHPDGSQLVSAGADRTLKVWDVKTRENTIALGAATSSFNAVAWSPVGPAVLAVNDAGALLRYTDLKVHSGAQSSDAASEREWGRAESPLFCVSAASRGGRVFAGSSAGRLMSWDQDGKLIDNLDVAAAAAPPVAAAP